ncbi:unnamed protein product [Effrenium voratum]|uniref:Uncharacterized protein n=1 Tax=Effrenium voratum TaxID=2562239 RepID=A0AA36MX15_9DINO|nr:unnamed protein product [Effrenium voratum]
MAGTTPMDATTLDVMPMEVTTSAPETTLPAHGTQPGIRLVTHEVEKQLRMVPGTLFGLTATPEGRSWKEAEVAKGSAQSGAVPRDIRGRQMFLGEAKEILKAFKEALLSPAVLRALQSIEDKGGPRTEQHRRVLITQEWNPIMKRFDFPITEAGYEAMKAGVRNFAENPYVRSCCHEVERLCSAPAGSYFGVPTEEEMQKRKAEEARLEEERKAEEAKRREEAKRAEALRRAEEEAKRRAEAKRKEEEEAKRKEEEEAKRKEEEAKEEARRKGEEEAKRKEEEEAKRKEEEEGKRKEEEDAKRQAEGEGKRKEEEDAKQKESEEARQAAPEATERAESEEATPAKEQSTEAETEVPSPESGASPQRSEAQSVECPRVPEAAEAPRAEAPAAEALAAEAPAAEAPAAEAPLVDSLERLAAEARLKAQKLQECHNEAKRINGYFEALRGLGLRKAAKASAELVGMAPKGAVLEGLIEVNGSRWLQLSAGSCRQLGALGDCAFALLHEELLAPATPPNPRPLGHAGRFEVRAERVAVHATPALRGEVVGVVYAGRMLMGTPHLVAGYAWLRFEESSRKKVEGAAGAWALIDGAALGLGLLLQPKDGDGRRALEAYQGAAVAPPSPEPAPPSQAVAPPKAPAPAPEPTVPAAEREVKAPTPVTDPVKVAQRVDAANLAKRRLSQPLQYRVLAEDHSAPLRKEPLVQSRELAKLERGEVVLGFPGGGWLQLAEGEFVGAWVFIGTRLSACWGELSVTARSWNALEVTWPGLHQEKKVAYNVEWRTPEGAAKQMRGHKVSASNKVVVGNLPPGLLCFRVGARVASTVDDEETCDSLGRGPSFLRATREVMLDEPGRVGFVARKVHSFM